MELVGHLQTYAWGKLGQSSLVARLNGGNIDDKMPYAELWMGTHPSGNSLVKETNIPLQKYIDSNPELLGTLENYWGKNKSLPFLLKVLSVNKALSIQVHPDKDTAEVLHRKRPETYKDANYKPEMAIALTDFRALSGFRPQAEIKEFFVNVTELQQVIRPDLISSYKKSMDDEIMRKIISDLLKKTEEEINPAVEEFLNRFEDADDDIKVKYKYDLVKTLYSQFPGDSGIFMVFFFNEVHLKPGEAMYIPAGLPHAYLYGDCIECMASSDNVVRAGLTPKEKEIELLVEILDYKSYTSDEVKLTPFAVSPFTLRYNPPVPDFGVSRVSIPEEESWLSPSHDSCQIFIVVQGEGICCGEKLNEPVPEISSSGSNTSVKNPESEQNDPAKKNERHEWFLKFGSIMFLPPYRRYKIICTKGPIEMYFAYSNSEFKLPEFPEFPRLHSS